MPEDIHSKLWGEFCEKIESGIFAVTPEIFKEMKLIPGSVGQRFGYNKANLVLEVGGAWDWDEYLNHAARMQIDHRMYISEFTGGSAKTICLNDLTIIALAKTLSLPVLSMEVLVSEDSGSKKRRIPNICTAEGVEHLRFNDFLRREGMLY